MPFSLAACKFCKRSACRGDRLRGSLNACRGDRLRGSRIVQVEAWQSQCEPFDVLLPLLIVLSPI